VELPQIVVAKHGLELRAMRNTAKGTAILVQARTGPEGSRRLRLPDFIKTAPLRW
jgi:hypothetical protein